jgi:small subunit ribosomal protein S1
MNEAQKRIGLSLREAHDDVERHRLQDYQRQAAVATSTVGDAIKQNYPGNDYRTKTYDEG